MSATATDRTADRWAASGLRAAARELRDRANVSEAQGAYLHGSYVAACQTVAAICRKHADDLEFEADAVAKGQR